jgi:hypothetical protein
MANATLTNVASSATSVTLLPANSARKKVTIWNNSTAILYFSLSSTASSVTACSVKMIADAFYEVPSDYTGAITGIWASANGAARITEIA